MDDAASGRLCFRWADWHLCAGVGEFTGLMSYGSGTVRVLVLCWPNREVLVHPEPC